MYNVDGNYQKKVGSKIKTIREEKAMTRDEVADLCHINKDYLRHIEAGIKMPSLPLIIGLCRVLDTSPNYILDFQGKENEILTYIGRMTSKEQKLLLDMIALYVSSKDKL